MSEAAASASLGQDQRADDTLHALARRIAAFYKRAGLSDQESRLSVCIDLLARRYPERLDPKLTQQLSSLLRGDRHYVIGAVYALLMPPKRRKRLSAFFTPPSISAHVVSQLASYGLSLQDGKVIDPACGGAAFLVPLATKIAAEHTPEPDAAGGIDHVLNRLVGLEIEPGLAALSEALIADTLGVESSTIASRVVKRGNALKLYRQYAGNFDAVIANPPYGRVFRPKQDTVETWAHVVTDGHVNTYALFSAAAIELSKPLGLIALVIPTSFIGGPYFSNFRRHVRNTSEVLQIELIQERKDAFLDVSQDTCVLYLRKLKTRGHTETGETNVFSLDSHGRRQRLGILQLSPQADGVWALPSTSAESAPAHFFDERYATLESYGFTVRTGYFVWNRNTEKLADRTEPLEDEIPLVWAQNVKPDQVIVVEPRDSKTTAKASFVSISPSSPAILRVPALVLQRTTNRKQDKRLIVGEISADLLKTYKGYVTENHTIVISPEPLKDQAITLSQMRQLLSSWAVDRMYRKISGTASVSTKLLRHLPLPDPKRLIKAINEHATFEEAVTAAYDTTVM